MDIKKVEQIKQILEYDSDMCLDPTKIGKDDCGYETGSPACIECQAHQICQLFRKTEDNPDGYKPTLLDK